MSFMMPVRLVDVTASHLIPSREAVGSCVIAVVGLSPCARRGAGPRAATAPFS